MIGQVGDEIVHLRNCRAVDQGSTLALNADQISMNQLFEMERQSGGWNIEHDREGAWREPVGRCTDERTKHPESGLLCEGAQGADGVFFIHVSNYIEICPRPRLRNGLGAMVSSVNIA